MSGFHSAMVLAPDEAIGVVALTNTGGLDGRNAMAPLAAALLRCRLVFARRQTEPVSEARTHSTEPVLSLDASELGS